MRLVGHFSYGAETPTKRERLIGKMGGFWKLQKAGTLVIDGVPELADMQNWILNFIAGGGCTVEFEIGLSRVHPKDDFVRKEGFKIAEANRKRMMATIESVGATKDVVRIEFQTEQGSFWVRFPTNGSRPQLDGQTFIDCNY